MATELRIILINQKLSWIGHMQASLFWFLLCFSLSFNMIAYYPFRINCVTQAGDHHTSFVEEPHICRYHYLSYLYYHGVKANFMWCRVIRNNLGYYGKMDKYFGYSLYYVLHACCGVSYIYIYIYIYLVTLTIITVSVKYFTYPTKLKKIY